MGLNVITDRGEHFSKEELRIEMDKFGQQMPDISAMLKYNRIIDWLFGMLGASYCANYAGQHKGFGFSAQLAECISP